MFGCVRNPYLNILFLLFLSVSQSVHQLLPPPYRDVWLEWRDGEQQQEERTRSAINKPRDQFISHLLARVKQQQPQLEPCPTDPSPSHCTEDSWEALADMEAEEKEDKKKEKEEKEEEKVSALELHSDEPDWTLNWNGRMLVRSGAMGV